MSEEIQDMLAQMDQQFQQKFQQKQSDDTPSSSFNPESPNKLINDVRTQQQQFNITQIPSQHLQTESANLDKNVIQGKISPKIKRKASSEDQQNYQEEDVHYKQLSNKLETALNKIQSMKTLKSPKSNGDMHARFDFYEKKRQKDIEDKRKQIEVKRSYGLKSKPDINPKSKTIVEQGSHHEPIYSRYEKILQDKRKRQMAIEHDKKEKEDQQYNAYLAQYQSHVKVPQNARTADQFYEGMKNWKQKKYQQAEQAAQKQREKELAGATFQPTINKTSKKLLQNKPRVPIYEREIQPKVVKQEYTFTPRINKRKAA